MRTVNVHEARAHLSALLDKVERGEEVAIARNGTLIARLVRLEQTAKRVPGSWNLQPGWENVTLGPAMFAPVTDGKLKPEGWE
jgi:prevent-host-death family protein